MDWLEYGGGWLRAEGVATTRLGQSRRISMHGWPRAKGQGPKAKGHDGFCLGLGLGLFALAIAKASNPSFRCNQPKAPEQGPRARPQDKRYRLTSPPLALLDGEFSRENQKISWVHGSLWASTMEGLESNESYPPEKDARPHGPPEKHSAGSQRSH